ncbi:acylneuraminate cytidylyltransferase family protein [Moorena bouillonii]|uniref:Acylneuraminate cytidylyltransferase n=1 Tax=Moorena bouillonii PNG TaxID=568701 RepID=A0A1U7MVC2_9CYAN|nr:acylneuraminate cytidylyltransferase family protein [Moorena bouillonii]OLT55932.1 acylneuraminate cytidylyltransferase [Moorena bouillonii PNG]
MTTVCIIPARGGSKGVPRKNIKPLNSLPLIIYSIIDATEASLVDQLYVTTDDAEIASKVEEYGASIIKRPDELAGDTASSELALAHALDEIERSGIHPNLIVFLQCTSPIRSGIDIDNAIQKLQAEDADSLVSVSPSHRFLWKQVDGVAKSINYDYRDRPRRQDMNPQYVENGSIYIFKPWVLQKLGNRLGGKISLFPMSEAAAHEIDSPLDFEIAEFFLNQQVASHAN